MGTLAIDSKAFELLVKGIAWLLKMKLQPQEGDREQRADILVNLLFDYWSLMLHTAVPPKGVQFGIGHSR